jgi:hypothetical protein
VVFLVESGRPSAGLKSVLVKPHFRPHFPEKPAALLSEGFVDLKPLDHRAFRILKRRLKHLYSGGEPSVVFESDQSGRKSRAGAKARAHLRREIYGWVAVGPGPRVR